MRFLIKILAVVFLLGSHAQILSQDSTNIVVYDVPPFDFNKWYIELSDSVADIDGNIYHTIKLGNQIWLKENLRVSKYNDGKPISLIQADTEWISTNKDAYSIYYTKNGTPRYYYNHKVVENNSNVCPCGWRIPDSADWQILENYVEEVNLDFNMGSHYGGGKDTIHLRKEFFDIWTSDIEGLSFSNQPFGYRSGIDGEYLLIGDFGHWWSKTGIKVATAWARIFIDRGFGIDDIHLSEYNYDHTIYSFMENHGLSIRCIKE